MGRTVHEVFGIREARDYRLGRTVVAVGQADLCTLVISAIVVVGDELADALFELTRQVIVLQQDTVLH